MTETTVQRLQRLVATQFNLQPADVRPDANLISDLLLDSLDCVELVMEAEEHFGVTIDDAKVWDGRDIIARSVEDLARVIDAARKGGAK